MTLVYLKLDYLCSCTLEETRHAAKAEMIDQGKPFYDTQTLKAFVLECNRGW